LKKKGHKRGRKEGKSRRPRSRLEGKKKRTSLREAEERRGNTSSKGLIPEEKKKHDNTRKGGKGRVHLSSAKEKQGFSFAQERAWGKKKKKGGGSLIQRKKKKKGPIFIFRGPRDPQGRKR